MLYQYVLLLAFLVSTQLSLAVFITESTEAFQSHYKLLGPTWLPNSRQYDFECPPTHFGPHHPFQCQHFFLVCLCHEPLREFCHIALVGDVTSRAS